VPPVPLVLVRAISTASIATVTSARLKEREACSSTLATWLSRCSDVRRLE
jgi:hypothetical protein